MIRTSRRHSPVAVAFLLAAALTMFGCAEQRQDVDINGDTLGADTMGAGAQERAMAELRPTRGNNASGTVTFTRANGGLRVEANVRGVAPGRHGFHVHEVGDCSAPDASSAGEHFQGQMQGTQAGTQPPGAQRDTAMGAQQDTAMGGQRGTQHGGPNSPQRHAGDLGNIQVGQDSTGRFSHTDNMLSLSGPNSVIGRSVVLHANEDDLTSQPAGNSGNRIACGEIRAGTGMGMSPGGTTPGAGMGRTPRDTAAARTPGAR